MARRYRAASACILVVGLSTAAMSGNGCAIHTIGLGSGGSGGDACAACTPAPCSDCDSGVCAGAACAPPPCADGIANGSETDIDCGGSDCKKCGAGKTCARAEVCAGGVCDGICKPNCLDGEKNNTETDIDCGGGGCNPCGPESACSSDDDCISQVCDSVTKKCQEATCKDDHLNGTETDIDCGGACDHPCTTGKRCNVGPDCESGVCMTVCQAPTCTDTVPNGYETDTDCGGGASSGCPRCRDEKRCTANGDCMGHSCVHGVCTTAACSDGQWNNPETDVDCGGPVCALCGEGKTCKFQSDCAAGLTCKGISPNWSCQQ